MKHGFLKAAAVSLPLKIADVAYNVSLIKQEIASRAKDGVELLVFPELSLCGYTCGDLLLHPFLTEKCLLGLSEIAEATKGLSMLVFVGLPFVKTGKAYNCAAALANGTILGLIPKTNIPNYAEFYERRYFSPASDGVEDVELLGKTVPFGKELLIADVRDKNVVVACEICEDVWVGHSPSTDHAAAGATVIVNLSASNEIVGKAEYRRTLICAHSGKNTCGYVYAGGATTESTTDLVFAGHNLIAESGTLLCENTLFSGDPAIAEIDVDYVAFERRKDTGYQAKHKEYKTVYAAFTTDEEPTLRKISRTPFLPNDPLEKSNRAELILTMQSQALAARLRHTGAKTAVIGISGGLDSSLALLVVARAFDLCQKDRKHIICVTMPGFGTTGKTFDNSLNLIQSIGATSKTVPIKDSVLQHFKDIDHDEKTLDVTYENAQARTRTLILMDLANKHSGLVVGTGDLSELALGWCTYNGDQMSMYSVNGSIPKTLVRRLVEFEGERLGGDAGAVLENILGTEISPELLPPDAQGNIAQKTEDLVGPYLLHDFFLYHVLRRGAEPKKLFALAKLAFKGEFTDEIVLKWLKNFYRRFFSQQFKRSCMPDGVKVGSVGLSPRGDWRMPSDASAALWLSEVEELS